MLKKDDVEAAKTVISTYPARRVINALISFYCHGHPLVRWRAIEATGPVVSRHAENEMESARVIIRRFLWMLNDESGGIGWGVPEAFGETLALSDRLCKEYHSIYLSYIQPSCNFLEHPVLQRGLLWGIGRLARYRQKLVGTVLADIEPFLFSEDPYHRAFAAMIYGYSGNPGSIALIGGLTRDKTSIEIYENGAIQTETVGRICVRAAETINKRTTS